MKYKKQMEVQVKNALVKFKAQAQQNQLKNDFF